MDLSSLKLTILLVTVVVNGLLALAVYKNNPKNATGRVFGGLSIVTILWLVDVFLSVTPAFIQYSLLWVRLSVFFATLQIMLFYILAGTLPYAKLQMKKRTFRYLLFITAVVMAITLSPLAFARVDITNGNVQAVPGPGIAIFGLFAVSLSFGAIYLLLKKLQQATGYMKDQYKYVVIGLISMLGLLIFTILIPVVFFKNSQFVVFAPLYTIIFLGMTTVAIVRHKLFDIRLVIARSVAYLLTVSTFVVVYTGAVLIISYLVFKDRNINTRAHFTYIALALLFTPTVYWLKRTLDRITNKLFFQDSYDSQAVLDELSRVLVGNLKLEELLKDSEQVITRNLNITFLTFAVYSSKGSDLRLIGGGDLDAEKFKHTLDNDKFNRQVVITENLTESSSELHNLLRSVNVAMVVRISTHEGRVGYLILGDKKSGNDYANADIKLLGIIADELALGVQNALRFEEIQQFNATLQLKVENATRELRRTNEKLKALDEAKDEFISMASHQLRTPLTSVKGYMSMVLEGDVGKISSQQREMLEQAFSSSQRMVYLIADLLNVSRLKTGKFVIEAVPTNLADVVESEIGQLVETAKAHNLELTHKKPNNFPLLNLDETKTRQVIMNFIDNAIYYTPAGGHINVELSVTDKTVEYRVVDDGLGVPASEQHHLFTKFYRAGNAKKARPDGTGLGLFMAKKVIIAQGGTIIFESQENKGSTFGFSLPRAALEVKK